MPDGDYKVLTVGRICEQKGQDIIPNIVEKLKKRNVSLKWYLLGEGDYESLIKQKIKEKGIEKDIILLGKKTNPYPYFKKCDLYVQTSRHEGFGITLTEAKFFLKPIITSSFAGADEQIKNGENGFIVNFNEDKFVEKIIYLKNNIDVQRKMIEKLKEEKLQFKQKQILDKKLHDEKEKI